MGVFGSNGWRVVIFVYIQSFFSCVFPYLRGSIPQLPLISGKFIINIWFRLLLVKVAAF